MTKTEIMKSSKFKSIIRNIPAIKDYTWEESKSGSVYYYHKSLSIGDGGKPNASFRISDHWHWTNKDGSIGCPVKDAEEGFNEVCVGIFLGGEYVLINHKSKSDLKAITDKLNQQSKSLNGSTRDKGKQTKEKVSKKNLVLNELTFAKENLEYFAEYDNNIAFTINGTQYSWDKNTNELYIYHADSHVLIPNTITKFK